MSNIGARRTAAKVEGRPSYVKRRTAILAAAAVAFRETGLHGTSMSEVAEILGTDRATLYYYFGSKEELFQDVVQSALIANAQLANRITSGPGTPIERLEALIQGLLDSYGQNYPHLYVFIQENLLDVNQEGPGWAVEMTNIAARYARAMARVIHEGVDEGYFVDLVNVRIVTNSIMGMVNWSHRWYGPDDSLTTEEIGKIMSTLVVGGIVKADGRMLATNGSEPKVNR